MHILLEVSFKKYVLHHRVLTLTVIKTAITITKSYEARFSLAITKLQCITP